MSDQQFISFSGFTGDVSIFSAQYTLTDGISPGVGILEVAPENGGLVDIAGAVTLGIGSQSITIADCFVVDTDMQVNTGGKNVLLQFVDGRYWWQFGEISGVYNTVQPNDNLDTSTEKTPQELATMLCQAIPRLFAFDVTAMPNDQRPSVDWDGANPAQELARLCDLTNCRIAYWVDGSLRIVVNGQGALLDPSTPSEARSVALSIKPKPAKIKLYGAPILYQVRLPLEAWMMDIDGQWKKKDDISYMPTGGWGNVDPCSCFQVDNTQVRQADGSYESPQELARATLWRCFRIVNDLTRYFQMIPDFQDSNGQGVQVLRKQLLPLMNDSLAVKIIDAEGIESVAPAFLSGEFWHSARPDFVNCPVGTKCELSFSVDAKRGIVSTSNFLIKYDPDAAGQYLDPVLELVIAVAVKDPLTRAWKRYSKTRDMADGAAGVTQILHQDDIQKTVIINYYSQTVANPNPLLSPGTQIIWDNTPPTENTTEVERFANYYLNAAERSWDRPDSATDRNPGIITAYRVDGAIRQISWSVDISGGATTTISRGTQHDDTVLPYKERRRREQQSLGEQALKDLKLQRGAGTGFF